MFYRIQYKNVRVNNIGHIKIYNCYLIQFYFGCVTHCVNIFKTCCQHYYNFLPIFKLIPFHDFVNKLGLALLLISLT